MGGCPPEARLTFIAAILLAKAQGLGEECGVVVEGMLTPFLTLE
jgi:hypothetical protein